MDSSTPLISCVSLGMVIIDEIRMPGKLPLIDVIGGSASFVTLGNRLFAQHPEQVGCLVLAGKDFPAKAEAALQEWGTALVIRRNEDAQSTRGLLEYKDDTFGPKSFEYTTRPLRASPTDLVDSPLLRAKAVHFFATPEEILIQVPELLRLRDNDKIEGRPLLVWEPLPVSCKPLNRQAFLDACKLVDVFSPNHIEITAIFADGPAKDFQPEKLESYGTEILDSSIGPQGQGTLIIRAGEQGSLTMGRSTRATWLPPFYTLEDMKPSKVVDPTGAGNTFLGGYMAGWLTTTCHIEATCHGHVAASFALEQIGLPKVEKKGDEELWNGASVMERLQKYKVRLRDAKVQSENVL
ncbi:putative PfkB family kinase [Lophiotrema nucula]|uniref:Putative PfkB family kinase n=1 Tax=Lophiotrema nucula TaxID=690887 RepID=A0A6A5Z7E5_9PLEO|nr:putative PfkB family kinase [Lophiotrema nucula]